MTSAAHDAPTPGEAVVIEDRDLPPSCRHCGNVMSWEDCGLCDEGYTPVGLLHECEPDWYDEDDVEPCEQCETLGGWWACSSVQCGLDRSEAARTKHRAIEDRAEDAAGAAPEAP